jgi:hypothetical protein
MLGVNAMGWLRRNKSWYYYHTFYMSGKYYNFYCGGGLRGLAFERFFRQCRVTRRDARRFLADLRAGRIGPTDPPDGSSAD